MARLTIENPNWGGDHAVTSAQGTEVLVDGQRIERVVSVDLHIAVGEPVAAEIHVWAMPDEEIELPADVTVVVDDPTPKEN